MCVCPVGVYWDSASKRESLSSVLDIQGEGGRLYCQTLYPLSHLPRPIYVFFYLFHIIYRIKGLLDRFSQAIRQPSETKKNCKWSTHRKKIKWLPAWICCYCLFLENLWFKMCLQILCFSPLRILGIQNVAIHSFLRFLLNTNWEQLFRVDNIAKQQDLCCKEFLFCWSTKQTKIGGLMEPSFPFLFQLQFRWKKIMPNYVDNCPWLLFHCFCGPDRS